MCGVYRTLPRHPLKRVELDGESANLMLLTKINRDGGPTGLVLAYRGLIRNTGLRIPHR